MSGVPKPSQLITLGFTAKSAARAFERAFDRRVRALREELDKRAFDRGPIFARESLLEVERGFRQVIAVQRERQVHIVYPPPLPYPDIKRLIDSALADVELSATRQAGDVSIDNDVIDDLVAAIQKHCSQHHLSVRR